MGSSRSMREAVLHKTGWFSHASAQDEEPSESPLEFSSCPSFSPLFSFLHPFLPSKPCKNTHFKFWITSIGSQLWALVEPVTWEREVQNFSGSDLVFCLMLFVTWFDYSSVCAPLLFKSWCGAQCLISTAIFLWYLLSWIEHGRIFSMYSLVVWIWIGMMRGKRQPVLWLIIGATTNAHWSVEICKSYKRFENFHDN